MHYMDTNPSWLRPYSVGEIIDISFKLYRSMFGQMIKAVAVVAVPAAILEGLITVSAIPHGFFSNGITVFGSSSAAGSGISTTATSSNLQQAASLINYILGFAATGLTTATCFKLVADAYLSVQPNWRTSISFGLKRLHSVLWTTLESTVIPFLPLIAVVLGAIEIGRRSLSAGVIIGVALGIPSLALIVWLWAAWRFNIIALIAEGIKGRHALGRSFSLVKNRWWPTFGIQLLMQLIVGIIGAIVSVPFSLSGVAMIANNHTAAGLLLTTAGSAISNILLMPLSASMLAVLYFDLRVRKEGLDLAIIASELGIGGIEGFAMPRAPRFAPQAAYPPYSQYPYPQQYPQYSQYPYPQQYPQYSYPQQYPQYSYPQQYPQYPDPQQPPQYPYPQQHQQYQQPPQHLPEGTVQQESPGYFKPPSDPSSGYLPPPLAGNYPPPTTYPVPTIPDISGTTPPPPPPTPPPPTTHIEDGEHLETPSNGENTWSAETQPPDYT